MEAPLLTRRSRFLPVALVPLVLVACVRRLDTPPPPKSYEGHYFRFPTGLQLAVYEVASAPRVSVTVSYGSGAHLDPSGQEGTAHLVEHLTGFGRAEGDRSIDARLFALGASDNAFTSADETCYVADAPPAALLRLLALEAERMRAPLANVTEAEFASERGVVDTERYQRSEEEDSPAALMKLALTQLFPDHGYGRPVGGTDASLRRIELTHVRQWARMHYTPDNAVVVVHGPVRPDQVKEQVERAFGGLALGDAQHPLSPPSSNTPPEAPVPLRKAPALKAVAAPISSRELWMVWPVPGRISGEGIRVATALVALQLALEHGVARDDRIEDVDVQPLLLDGMGVVAARLELSAGADAFQVERDMRRTFQIPAEHYWSDLMAKMMAERMATMSLAGLEGDFGPAAATYVRTARRADFAAAFEQQILTGTTPEFFADARNYFPADQFRALLFVPTQVGKAFREQPPVQLAAAASGDLSVRSLPADAPSPSELIAPLPAFETETLGNGMKLVIVRRPQLPLIESRLVLRTRPLAALASPLVPSIAVTLGGGIDWSGRRQAYDGHAVYEVRSLSGDRFYLALESMGMWARDTLMRWDTFDRIRNLRAERYESASDPGGVRVAGFAYEHLFGKPVESLKESAKQLRALDGALVKEWLERELRPQNATLILVGDVPSVGAVKAMVFWAFFGWGNTRVFEDPPPPSASVPWPAAKPAPAAAKVLLHARRAALAQITVAVRGPSIPLSSHASWAVLSAAVENRLRAELRQRRGIAYGVSSVVMESAAGNALMVHTSVRPEHAAQVISHVRDTVRAFKEAGVPAEEVAQARWDVARSFDSGFATLEGTADRIQAVVRLDGSVDAWSVYRDALVSTAADAVSAAARELRAGAEAITVTGNVADLEATLKAGGLQVEVVK